MLHDSQSPQRAMKEQLKRAGCRQWNGWTHGAIPPARPHASCRRPHQLLESSTGSCPTPSSPTKTTPLLPFCHTSRTALTSGWPATRVTSVYMLPRKISSFQHPVKDDLGLKTWVYTAAMSISLARPLWQNSILQIQQQLSTDSSTTITSYSRTWKSSYMDRSFPVTWTERMVQSWVGHGNH